MVFRNLLYFIAVLLLIGWVLGFLVWKHEGYMVHSLLLLGAISLILAFTRKAEAE